ncbi:hypothetical protein NDI37_06755 [Funiculus sociatus GB2-A5]|uniref:Uncharacterized protein n=1 Tax=Funiculus sociatus GB2-A5 TaxID=2933946 RepID=A0ABV0JL49_9CYAN|nr:MULTISPECIES: hypothetical protein [unclassified Trichocoleus]MBD1905753.1 hypothetical protein [Trichocoleus sp. FACHB-832]MBD2065894.1 hypothetical protein [Trichocoleus sp. FACHB-6]
MLLTRSSMLDLRGGGTMIGTRSLPNKNTDTKRDRRLIPIIFRNITPKPSPEAGKRGRVQYLRLINCKIRTAKGFRLSQ